MVFLATAGHFKRKIKGTLLVAWGRGENVHFSASQLFNHPIFLLKIEDEVFESSIASALTGFLAGVGGGGGLSHFADLYNGDYGIHPSLLPGVV